MSKLYKCTNKEDGKTSHVLVNDMGAAWMYSGPVDIVKQNERLYAYDPVDSFIERAIDPVLIAEW